jgi:phosphoribosylamine---glycine ligase
MRVLLVGSGAREHALAWAIAASPLCAKLWCAPGNAGIAREAECVAIGADDIAGLVAFARDHKVELVVVGPEAPLVAGLVDALEKAGVAAFGPNAAAAALEGSKAFMKDLCAQQGIPTAAYGRFRDADAAKAFVRHKGAPIVVKADGLAAGKGVTVAATIDQALAAIDEAITARRFGAAGAEVIVEEFLDGEEASFFALCDGAHALALATAQDHKRAFDGDQGPNTGGMGAYSPAPVVTQAIADEVMAKIIRPTLAGMAARGAPFKGILFAGLMIGRDGPKLLEFNVRFGDPECQALLVRLRSDLLPALIAAHAGGLKNFDLRWDPRPSVCVVMAARGYPDAGRKDTEIRRIEAAASTPNVQVFQAGTRLQDGRLLAPSGRALGVTALGATIAEARASAYRAVDALDWPDGFCRRDIAAKAQ